MFGKTHDKDSDENLLARSAKGDRRAFEILYARYADRLYHYFHKMLWQDEELARDQTQEVFMILVKKPERFDTTKNFKTWIFSIAHNMCKNHYRHREVQLRAQEEILHAATISQNGTAHAYDQKIFKVALDDALSSLDSQKRNTFILRFKHDLSIKEIATVTETSEGTVKSRLYYTIRELAQILSAFNPNPDHEILR